MHTLFTAVKTAPYKRTIITLLITVAILHAYGWTGIYFENAWYDNIVHFMGGFTSAFILVSLYTATGLVYKKPQRITFALMLLGILCISAAWELHELVLDQLRIAQGMPLIHQPSWGDTITDTLTNIVGMTLAYMYITIFFTNEQTTR